MYKANFKAARGMSIKSAKQKGFTFIELVVVLVVLGVLAFAAYQFGVGKRGETDFSRGVKLMTSDTLEVLGAIYENNAGTYGNLGGATFDADSAKDSLVARGLPTDAPWRQDWAVQSRPAGGQSLVLDWPCANLPAGCTELLNALNSRVAADPIGNNAAANRGITAVTTDGTGATEAIRITYGRPA
ncbi:prepilin-type N-terminal cleavage/methylation domain-containing protein (plasmid) [Flagellatimonas centrodinii]|uniref:prepilin-type N-terminal cleavage/methylation domain-containing protein n=1 Tax=Flagellatimonas centrodinii TaxID=2806210 RepID=UPI001FF90E98|nr:prepilin-type N-terminal cleavage/methylation domain-containing protein [Flagellatimonas centrodinii]ULQ48444.1 prepilin-type N-terminal cleavage/methylation domain-containing protein [Flagellatimonas centrodinii]